MHYRWVSFTYSNSNRRNCSASITISMSCASSDSTLPMLCVASIQIFFQIGKKKTLFMLKRVPSKYDVSINLWPWELLWHLEFHRRGMCELQIDGSDRCLHLFFLTTQIGRADATVGFPLRPPPFRYLWSTCHRCTPSIIGVVLSCIRMCWLRFCCMRHLFFWMMYSALESEWCLMEALFGSHLFDWFCDVLINPDLLRI